MMARQKKGIAMIETAVVTGAASGIGLGIARALIAQGAHVVLADIEIDRARAAAKDLGASIRLTKPVSSRSPTLRSGSWDRLMLSLPMPALAREAPSTQPRNVTSIGS